MQDTVASDKPKTRYRHFEISKRSQERFFALVSKTDGGCWLWQGKLTKYGYARIYVDGHMIFAHRVSYVISNGNIADGKCLDHLCRNRSCVNPNHLQAVSIGENVLRGQGLSVQNLLKKYCPRGHELAGTNLIRSKSCRTCRICRNKLAIDRKRERQARMTHCKNGHPKTPENAGSVNGFWCCRICRQEASRRTRQMTIAKKQAVAHVQAKTEVIL